MELQVNLKEWLKKLVYMKTEVDTKLSSKANTNHTHDIASLPDENDILGHMENDFHTALDTKANKTTATTSANGLMSKEDKSKLDGIATGANKTVVDSSLSSSSTNPVQNKVVNSALSGKANSSHSHSISNITNLQSTLNAKSGTGHTHDDRYYTETEMNTKLNGKANVNHSHDSASSSENGFLSKEDKSKLDGIATEANKTVVDSSLSSSSTNPVQNKIVTNALNGKANSSHSHSISNITNLQSALDSKSETGHTHDDRYYTETEMNTKLNGKANSSHTHTASQISDLTVSTHTLANGAKLYKYGKIVMCVLFNVAFSGKKAYTWNNLFVNIPSAYQLYGGADPVYSHASDIMISVQGSTIQIYPNKTSGSVFMTLVWITA